MNILDTIILGIVEGVTEFLPISSTGHLILASHFLKLPETDFLKTFEVVIQLGAIGAAVFLYWRRLLFDRELLKRVAVALLPAFGVGFLFYSVIDRLLGSELTVLTALFVGGILIILFELWHRRQDGTMSDLSHLHYPTALAIGLFQALSVIPGVSRAGATILGGLALGLTRQATVEFSFLLAIPTMIGATSLQLYKNHATLSGDNLSLLFIGFLTAFVVALMAIKFFIRFIGTHTFIPFGVYRIVVAVLFLLLIY